MMKTFKTLTSFFRFYWYAFKRSPKQYNIAMNVNESTAVAMTPLFGFLALVFSSMVFGTLKVALFFPLAIPVVLGNMFIVHKVRDKGYEIQREEERKCREAEEMQREYERARERARREAEYIERRRRLEEEMERLYERLRRERERQEQYRRQQQYEQYRRQQQASTNNMTNAIKLLGLTEGFTVSDVKKAYRRLSKIHHPDVGGKQENFIKLKKAYDYVMSRI